MLGTVRVLVVCLFVMCPGRQIPDRGYPFYSKQGFCYVPKKYLSIIVEFFKGSLKELGVLPVRLSTYFLELCNICGSIMLFEVFISALLIIRDNYIFNTHDVGFLDIFHWPYVFSVGPDRAQARAQHAGSGLGFNYITQKPEPA
jgi:hypothetical protein